MPKRTKAAVAATANNKQLKEYQEFHSAPIPSGLIATREAPILQQSTNHTEEIVDELNLFDSLSLSTQILAEESEEIQPVASITQGSAIEFNIRTGTDQYLYPAGCSLAVELKITQANDADLAVDANAPANNSQIAPANNILHTLFHTVDVYLNNRKITQPNDLYHVVAYICQLVNHSKETLKNLKICSGWHKDVAGQMDTAGPIILGGQRDEICFRGRVSWR